MKIVLEESSCCFAGGCANKATYRLCYDDGGSVPMCSFHAEEMCALQMPKPEFMVREAGHLAKSECGHDVHGAKTYIVVRNREGVVTKAVCVDCAIAIAILLESQIS